MILDPRLLLFMLAACNSKSPIDADIVISNVTVIDGTGAAARPAMSVAILGDRIVAVEPTSKLKVASRVIAVDGRGKFVIPGLWDMHVHLGNYFERSFPLFLANGVTTIRDMGDDLAKLLWLRQESRYGRLLGPELLIAGPVLDSPYIVQAVGGSVYAAGRAAVPDSATAVAMVDSLSRIGVDHIKVHGMTPRAAYFAILERAKEKKIPVVGHIPDSVGPVEAIRAGQRMVEHDSKLSIAESSRGREINGWMLAMMQRAIGRTRDRPNVGAIFPFRLAADDSAVASFDPEVADRFAKLAKEHRVWFDPTFVVMEALLRINEPEVRDRPELKYVPRAARGLDEGIKPNPNPTPEDVENGRRKFAAQLAQVRPLVQAGVGLLAGTDVPVMPLVPGFALHRELGLLVQAGLTPMQAIQAATLNAAEATDRLEQLGTIEAGKLASVVLLDADPLADIGNTTKIRAVISRGRLLDRSTLDRMLEDAEAFAR